MPQSDPATAAPAPGEPGPAAVSEDPTPGTAASDRARTAGSLAQAAQTLAAATPKASLIGVSKRFGGVRAVDGVSLTIRRGEVHALVGENGAGKSTLSKIISGLVRPDDGELLVDGRTVSFGSPRDALAHGIATIAQELALVPGLTVAQNVYLGAEPRRLGFVRRRALARQYAQLAAETGFDLPGTARTGSLRTADQQKVEILRAVSRGASVIIMDEPTAALSRVDARKLHEVIRDLARAQVTVVLITHFLSEALELADTVSVMRDGQLVRSGPASAETEASLVEAMLGRSLGSVFPPKPPVVDPSAVDPVLTVESLTAPGVRDVSLAVRPGEIVGLAGLVGAGRTELAHALFGNARASAGTVRLAGAAPIRGRRGGAPATPRRALRSGLFLIPESRKDSGLLLNRSVAENITLSTLPAHSQVGLVNGRRQRGTAREIVERVKIRTASVQAPVWTLSGGNQQKVLFARALLRRPRLLIADEPTRGVDVGSRHAIYELIAEQARAGLGVLVISSDVEEVLGLAHRVLVMRGGRITAELTGDRLTEHEVLTAAFSEADRIAAGSPAATRAVTPGPDSPDAGATTRVAPPTTETQP
jgi:simple sugar transport system ATP-binding protein/ribose transport system ATP-binding protein